MKITQIVKKMKDNNLDDYDTDYVDVDLLLDMYLQEFRNTKRDNLIKLSKQFKSLVHEQEKERDNGNWLTFSNALKITTDYRYHSTSMKPTQFLSHAGPISTARALMYAMMCGKNGPDVSDVEFLAGCNRFGIDNPLPPQTKRLQLYGNVEDMDKIIENLFRKHNEPSFLNPDRFGHVPDKTKGSYEGMTLKDKPKIIDMKETTVKKRNTQKRAGAHDLRMLDRIENAHKFDSPAVEILARNYKIKIKDILQEGCLKNNRDKMDKMTSIEWGVSEDKQILVPSFGTTGALFARHFDILRNLRRRILLLKQSYED